QGSVVSWVGQKLGGYLIDAEIGHGGMATVYRSYQPQLERWVAIKVLTPAGDDKEFLEAFRREAKAVAALRHPNILTIYDYGEESGVAYIVMEYIDGGTLKDRLDNHILSWAEAARLVIPVARALAHAHSKNIIHCDIKPANILLPRPDWPLLADFGLLQLRTVHYENEEPSTITGTPAYISPEQMTGERIGRYSDVYSLGVILYQLLTGRLPFQATSPGSTMLQRLLEPPPSPSLYARLPEGMEEIILRALARKPADRYPDMDTLIADLSAIPGTPHSGMLIQQAPMPSGTSALSDHQVMQGPHLIFPGTETILSLPLQREVVMGRFDPESSKQPDVDLTAQGAIEAGVSRRHARLLHTVQGWILEDLNSTNGTSLNMAPARPGERLVLHSGDVIRCGRLMLVFYET
ncbi:MAG: FHA domain-containing serine/threonine-protein kinase, partial [Chloroflexi bacterium]|nr:FHA domain-containing serine/threonine-protein kinase [Chloroflexota bacterium]MCI0725329.1 FHA domain-containing serine/threonine-protein kinase [Chloroflexota bacterium]